ncbi:MAG: hypothetical protein FWB95_09435 [Treponema sp.]|nr:hypothetical protein [Treponema sp.]
MKTKFNVLIIALIVVFVATFTACEEPEPTVTVYTGTISPTEFESVFVYTPPTVGYFVRSVITVTYRDHIASRLNASPSISKVEWTESDISDFFINAGFIDPKRTELINWFNGEDHALLYDRASEDTVNIILK